MALECPMYITLAPETIDAAEVDSHDQCFPMYLLNNKIMTS